MGHESDVGNHLENPPQKNLYCPHENNEDHVITSNVLTWRMIILPMRLKTSLSLCVVHNDYCNHIVKKT